MHKFFIALALFFGLTSLVSAQTNTANSSGINQQCWYTTGTNYLSMRNMGTQTWQFGESTNCSDFLNPLSEFNTTGSANVGGTARIFKDVRVSKTANYSIGADGLSSDGGKQFDNCGASGEVDFTLPTAVVGLTYGFTVCASQTLKIIAGASTSIAISGTNSAAAGNITDATVYGSITLEAISTTQWYAKSVVGTWTVN